MKRLIVALLLPLTLAAGCASGLGGTSYSRSEAGRVGTVQHGTITSLRPVQIEGTKTGVGAGAGALAGGIAASGVSGGKTGAVAAVIGAVAGGLLGAMTEEGLTRADGVEIGLKMDDGRELSIVQALDPNEVLRVGDKVRVLYSGGKARVAPGS